MGRRVGRVLGRGVLGVVWAVVVVRVRAEGHGGRALDVCGGGGVEDLVVVREGNHGEEKGEDWKSASDAPASIRKEALRQTYGSRR